MSEIWEEALIAHPSLIKELKKAGLSVTDIFLDMRETPDGKFGALVKIPLPWGVVDKLEKELGEGEELIRAGRKNS